ncbi:aminoglycoside phosphotransferase [endosymbiont of Acanthamoeba sp. UWC8]|uniref:aminoglycoside phosphotransferase family protein n=1 Tax=endosymbiont of Acanthamoeba sp. UWC8 TaxID=86106 RepID=UPI0004D1253B|nr:aminoglycoside phosphotransferase family protein [endosymbiont of Acanthamoeba sp. UWC8]AIF82079.1 aminoglycoside phosphotransferase [endosymbiont of Acanthamoeba sp. UWC8]
MEQLWERRKEFHTLTESKIKKLSDNALNRDDIIDIHKTSNGLANTNYILMYHNGDKFVLRLYTRDSNAGLKEFNLANLLCHEALVPKCVKYFPVSEAFQYAYSFVEYKKGILLSNYLDKPDLLPELLKIYKELGQFLARLKAYRFEGSGSLNPDLTVSRFTTKHNENNPYINFILDCINMVRVKNRLGTSLFNRIKNVLKIHHDLFPKLNNDYHLVHGDFKPTNILVYESEGALKISGIIDWEFAYAGSGYSDIANLFRFKNIFDEQLKGSFAEGYKSRGGSLNKEWEKSIKLVDLINLCDLLSSEEERPNMHTDIIKLITESLNFIER